MRKLLPAAALLLTVGACSSVPDGVLKPRKMEQVLYETHIAEALIDEYPSRYRTADDKQQLVAAVFRDNGITKAQFDSSMGYYSAHLDQYMKIYDRVTARLNAEADRAQEAKLAYERTLLTPVGDSVDIWRRGRQLVINPLLGSATQQFEIKGDTNFRADDRIVWSLRLANLPDSAQGYLCATFGYRTKDTVVVTTLFPKADTTLRLELNLPLLGDATTKLFGALTMLSATKPLFAPQATPSFAASSSNASTASSGNASTASSSNASTASSSNASAKAGLYTRGADELEAMLHPVFADQISLMRYHKKEVVAEAVGDSLTAEADSLAVDSLAVDSLEAAAMPEKISASATAAVSPPSADASKTTKATSLPPAPTDGSAVKASPNDMPKPVPVSRSERAKVASELKPENELKAVEKH